MVRRFRKNWGNRLDRNKNFVDRDDVLKEYKANERIQIVNTNDKYDPSSHNAYDKKSNQINREIKKEVMGMMFGNEELMNVDRNTDVVRYVEKDNYNKYLYLKGNLNFFVVLSNQYFWAIYSIVVVILGCIEMLRMLSELNLSFITTLVEMILPIIEQYFGDINPNWGFILIPLIIHTIYKSFNSYSFIKISF